jgi:superfamily I DNA/RNA helicase
MTFVPSKYQKAVYIYIQKGKGNAVIDAVAGSGKSTTIVNALKLIPEDKRVLFLAFNKAIVEELKIKIGNMNNVEVKTIHSLGASSVMRCLNSKLSSDKYRSWVNNGIKYGAIKPIVSLSDEEMSNWKQNIIKLIDLGRVNLIKNEKELDDMAFKHNIDVLDNEIDIAIKGIKWGESETQIIDFTDMIYFPNVKKIPIEQYDWVFIDECQDLNAAQRNLFLKCLKPNGRFVAVGDPRQAIYGFAGADVESFNLLKSIPNTVKLPLSVCYRCDSDIINSAKELVPQIEARDNAPSGIVSKDSLISDVKDGDMILCRVSAPLIKLCMQYISKGVKAYVKGRDIGTNLTNMIKKTNRNQISDVIERLERESSRIIGKVVTKQKCTEEEAKETEIYKTYEDKLKAIEVLSEGLLSTQEVIDRIDMIFSDNKDGICLSTIHKSKGLESDRVFIICEDKLYLKYCMQIPWMAEQEKNLVYVAITRAKHFLGYIKDFSCV